MKDMREKMNIDQGSRGTTGSCPAWRQDLEKRGGLSRLASGRLTGSVLMTAALFL